MSSSGCVSPGLTVPWISPTDMVTWAPSVSEDAEQMAKLDVACAIASDLMFELSGRQFPGVQERTVRPCRSGCDCWGNPSSGMSMWSWQYGSAYGWYDEGGNSCGCGGESYIKLAGFPVCEILAVKLDGALLAPTDYRLDRRRDLIYMADANGLARMWPVCQRLDLDDSQSGTFSVRYTWGTGPPELGKLAAAQIGGEIWKALSNNDNRLPSRVTKIVRQGVTVDKVVSAAKAIRQGATGLPLVDMFIAQSNPTGMLRKPIVISPDVQRPARKLGQ